MKIGEAGEAFFVFETQDDVPEDLITSPILEATETLESQPHSRQANGLGPDDNFALPEAQRDAYMVRVSRSTRQSQLLNKYAY